MSGRHSRNTSVGGDLNLSLESANNTSANHKRHDTWSSLESPMEPEPEKLQTVIISHVNSDKKWLGLGREVSTEIYTPSSSSGSTPVKLFGNRPDEDKPSSSALFLKVLAIISLLYFFVCSLDTLSNSFRLIAGRAAGEVFQQQELLNNPVVGVMIGILVTVAVQSSSTSTSIVVSMVASGLFTVKTAIPIVMGANIGTSVTNTVVALTHMSNREDFERAFAGSVLHDMFNLLAVGSLLIIEQLTSYLEVTTTAILNSFDFSAQKGTDVQVLSRITKPLTSWIVQVDKNVIIGWSLGDPHYENSSLLKKWCNKSSEIDGSIVGKKCDFIFNYWDLSDVTVGIILLAASLAVLVGCLICLVKVLSSLLKGKLAVAVQKGVNSNVPYCPFLTGYLALGIGAIMTILVQSSSVFTSAMTPLIAIGMISLERAYPLTLGSNLGTTTTAMLAAFAAEGPNLRWSIQLAMCHFLFNLTGILLFYPIPFTRFPIRMAKALGRITARYRWFAIFYLVFAFCILPLIVFSLSLIGAIAFYCVMSVVGVILIFAVAINLLQDYAPERLPTYYRTWDFLPLYLHSLEPYDRIVQKVLDLLRRTCCAACCSTASQERSEFIKPPEHSNSLGLDNFAFADGDQTPNEVPILGNNCDKSDVEQTQL